MKVPCEYINFSWAHLHLKVFWRGNTHSAVNRDSAFLFHIKEKQNKTNKTKKNPKSNLSGNKDVSHGVKRKGMTHGTFL